MLTKSDQKGLDGRGRGAAWTNSPTNKDTASQAM
jgi:hypothetical protein